MPVCHNGETDEEQHNNVKLTPPDNPIIEANHKLSDDVLMIMLLKQADRLRRYPPSTRRPLLLVLMIASRPKMTRQRRSTRKVIFIREG